MRAGGIPSLETVAHLVPFVCQWSVLTCRRVPADLMELQQLLFEYLFVKFCQPIKDGVAWRQLLLEKEGNISRSIVNLLHGDERIDIGGFFHVCVEWGDGGSCSWSIVTQNAVLQY